MLLLDRYLIRRFLTNFVILFALVYVLATSIDLILQLDEFMQAVDSIAGEDAGFFASASTLAKLVVNFHGPRIFQLYAYLLGLVSVGAMGFTLAQMVRHRELVAMLASGMSLYRVAWPIVIAAFLLNLIHLVNSNMILPQLAPLLIRGHGDLATSGTEAFAIPFTADGAGALIQSPGFHRDTNVLERPTVLVRDARGRTRIRISADSGQWDDARQGWALENGWALIREDVEAEGTGDIVTRRETVELFRSDLSPRVLVVRRYAEFAQMLSPSQIAELMATPGAVDVAGLARIRYGRYSVVLSNILMLLLTLPFFLLRQPGNMLRQSVLCAAVALGAMLGAFIGMEVEFEALPPAVSVFLPVIVLVPLALAAASFVRT